VRTSRALSHWRRSGESVSFPLDDPKLYGGPQMAINTLDKQLFHVIPEGLPTFERLPPR
jgi:hypothetical protein